MIGISKESQLKKFKEAKKGRVSKKELKNRIEFVLNKEVCQVCNKSAELDYPHHSEFGISKKNDKSLINICVSCHREIHNKGFPIHGLSREDTIRIGINNNNEFELLYKV
tara:strand:+ start:925 stop:1254 length:330 start_codon:yes stop_codon:yes gene_type:complete